MAQDTVANFNSAFFTSCGSMNNNVGATKKANVDLGEKRCIQTDTKDPFGYILFC